MWDPATYLRFGDERARPFFDLLSRVGATAPRAVVDLGCGPGNLTAEFAKRWPEARIRGVDSSPEMIGRAAAAYPMDFEVGDLRDWTPEADTDVVVSNAALQWVPGHEALLARWAGALPAGAWLAVQVPGNFDVPSHLALRELSVEAGLGDIVREAPVLEPAGYADLLAGAGCAVDAWEATYLHRLPVVPGADHPVLTWMDGTALRPMRARLRAEAWQVFRDTLGKRLAEVYPVRGTVVSFPFRRIFVVARTQGD
ncbi:trans-aconitate 2-methyltransferase [Phytohabitans kaempferiae]|uniref:Trans-aconitate 2-methyltransferase n=1 Tax=Phytohabitans kaempferiae TaxID=1620943 RepID=A0ABV6M1K9_9ACTN